MLILETMARAVSRRVMIIPRLVTRPRGGGLRRFRQEAGCVEVRGFDGAGPFAVSFRVAGAGVATRTMRATTRRSVQRLYTTDHGLKAEKKRKRRSARCCRRQAARKFDDDAGRRLAEALAEVTDAERLAEVGDWIIECERRPSCWTASPGPGPDRRRRRPLSRGRFRAPVAQVRRGPGPDRLTTAPDSRAIARPGS